jgi:RHS repeat-associated protein
MRGRQYDPKLGQFIQPDPIVQAPDYSQSWNRYAYVFNNAPGGSDRT